MFPGAALTRHHQLGGLKQRSVLPTALETRRRKCRGRPGRASSEKTARGSLLPHQLPLESSACSPISPASASTSPRGHARLLSRLLQGRSFEAGPTRFRDRLVRLEILDLITSAETLFPHTVTFTGFGAQDEERILWGNAIQSRPEFSASDIIGPYSLNGDRS